MSETDVFTQAHSPEILKKPIPTIEMTAPYPWRRYFARTLDLALYSLPWFMFCQFILRWKGDSSLLFNIIAAYMSWLFVFLIEPILLSKLGTTPGKWIFGLEIRDENGQKLRYDAALSRTFGVFKIGAGFNIPLFNIFTQYESFVACKQNRILEWDEGIRYHLKDKNNWRIAGFLLVCFLMFLLVVLIMLQAQMPKYRGDLTEKQFFANCSDLMHYNNTDFGKILDSKGNWIDPPSNDGNIINLFSQPLPEYSVSLHDGKVSAVKIEVESTKDAVIGGYINHMAIATVSFVGAQDGINFAKMSQRKLIEKLGNGLENCSFDIAGVRITNTVEYSGYNNVSNGYLWSNEGGEQYFHLVFTMEKSNTQSTQK